MTNQNVVDLERKPTGANRPQAASLLHPGRPRPLTALLQVPSESTRGKSFALAIYLRLRPDLQQARYQRRASLRAPVLQREALAELTGDENRGALAQVKSEVVV